MIFLEPAAERGDEALILLLLRILLTGATMLITGPLLLAMSRQLTPPTVHREVSRTVPFEVEQGER